MPSPRLALALLVAALALVVTVVYAQTNVTDLIVKNHNITVLTNVTAVYRNIIVSDHSMLRIENSNITALGSLIANYSAFVFLLNNTVFRVYNDSLIANNSVVTTNYAVVLFRRGLVVYNRSILAVVNSTFMADRLHVVSPAGLRPQNASLEFIAPERGPYRKIAVYILPPRIFFYPTAAGFGLSNVHINETLATRGIIVIGSLRPGTNFTGGRLVLVDSVLLGVNSSITLEEDLSAYAVLELRRILPVIKGFYLHVPRLGLAVPGAIILINTSLATPHLSLVATPLALYKSMLSADSITLVNSIIRGLKSSLNFTVLVVPNETVQRIPVVYGGLYLVKSTVVGENMSVIRLKLLLSDFKVKHILVHGYGIANVLGVQVPLFGGGVILIGPRNKAYANITLDTAALVLKIVAPEGANVTTSDNTVIVKVGDRVYLRIILERRAVLILMVLTPREPKLIILQTSDAPELGLAVRGKGVCLYRGAAQKFGQMIREVPVAGVKKTVVKIKPGGVVDLKKRIAVHVMSAKMFRAGYAPWLLVTLNMTGKIELVQGKLVLTLDFNLTKLTENVTIKAASLRPRPGKIARIVVTAPPGEVSVTVIENVSRVARVFVNGTDVTYTARVNNMSALLNCSNICYYFDGKYLYIAAAHKSTYVYDTYDTQPSVDVVVTNETVKVTLSNPYDYDIKLLVKVVFKTEEGEIVNSTEKWVLVPALEETTEVFSVPEKPRPLVVEVYVYDEGGTLISSYSTELKAPAPPPKRAPAMPTWVIPLAIVLALLLVLGLVWSIRRRRAEARTTEYA